MELCFHLFGVPTSGLFHQRSPPWLHCVLITRIVTRDMDIQRDIQRYVPFRCGWYKCILDTLDQDVDSSAQPLNWKLIYLCSGLLRVVLKWFTGHNGEYSAASQHIEIKINWKPFCRGKGYHLCLKWDWLKYFVTCEFHEFQGQIPSNVIK